MICRNEAADKSLLHRKVRVPTPEEDVALIKAAQAGDLDARNELVVRHLPAIIKYAGTYYVTHGHPNYLEIDDLIQIGVFGIIHAIRKYDQEKADGRFITYAKHWMRNYMDKALDTYRMFRVPATTVFAYKKGRLKNPETKRAIACFRNIVPLETDRVYDQRSSPLEEAILKEEFQNAGLTE